MSALAHYQQQFLATANAHGLRLATHGGSDGAPSADLYRAAGYAPIRAASQRLHRYRTAAANGQMVAGQRVDSARGNIAADANLAAHVAEWAQYFHEGDRRHGGHGNQRADSGATLEALAADIASGRMDGLSPMGNEGLTSILPDVYQYAHDDLPAWDGKLLPIDSSSVDPAAEWFTWYEVDNVGVAKAGSTYAMKDVPMVAGPAAQTNLVMPIMPFLVGMETNFMEARREALGVRNGKPNFDIDMRKREMCDRAIAEAVNNLWLYGDPLAGIEGLWNSSSVSTLSITGVWAGKTSAAIAADLLSMFSIFDTTTGDLVDRKKVRLILPIAQYDLAANQPMTAAGSESVLSYFLKVNDLKATQVTKVRDLAASNSSMWNGGPNGLTSDRALVMYVKGDRWDPKFMLPQKIEMPAPPRQNGMGETTFFHARAGGMMVADARRIRYVVGM